MSDCTNDYIYFYYFDICDHDQKLIMLFEKSMKESMAITLRADH